MTEEKFWLMKHVPVDNDDLPLLKDYYIRQTGLINRLEYLLSH